MKVFVLLALVGTACAAALPAEAPAPVEVETAAVSDVPEYTKEVADARAAFQAAFDAAVAGEGPLPFYIEYTKEVADARADFQAAYDAAVAGGVVAAEETAPEEAPVAVEETKEVTEPKAAVLTLDSKLSPLYANALAYSAFGIHSPFLAGAPFISNVKIDTEPLADVSPLTYSSLGFPGPFGFFGYPIVKVADAEE